MLLARFQLANQERCFVSGSSGLAVQWSDWGPLKQCHGQTEEPSRSVHIKGLHGYGTVVGAVEESGDVLVGGERGGSRGVQCCVFNADCLSKANWPGRRGLGEGFDEREFLAGLDVAPFLNEMAQFGASLRVFNLGGRRIRFTMQRWRTRRGCSLS